MLLFVPPQRGSRPPRPEFASAAGPASPRKQPVQDRSRATVDAILTATFRVLDEHGAEGLTTTRVAATAGVSVGTLYQYFPNKQALVTGLLAAPLDVAVQELERIAAEVGGEPPDVQVERLVRGFVAVKARRAAISRAMQPALAGVDERPLVRTATRRAAAIVARLFARGGEPDPDPIDRAAVVCAAMEGVITTAIAEDPSRLSDPGFVDQLVALARGGAIG